MTSATAERPHRDLPEEINDAGAPKQLFLLYVHTARTDALDLSSVVNAFASANVRRSNFLGTFRTSVMVTKLVYAD